MNTSLKALSLLLAVAIPSAIIAEFLGVHLPAVINANLLFSAFVTALTLLTAFADYSRPTKTLTDPTRPARAEAEIVEFSQRPANTRLAA